MLLKYNKLLILILTVLICGILSLNMYSNSFYLSVARNYVDSYVIYHFLILLQHLKLIMLI